MGWQEPLRAWREGPRARPWHGRAVQPMEVAGGRAELHQADTEKPFRGHKAKSCH